uniref:C2H2-type domain-containing protein n=2 Tax=Caenorhabditis japonica TaxID=281687 RepID=A0A8R1IX84_CAEJA
MSQVTPSGTWDLVSSPHLFFLLPEKNIMSNKGFHQCPICYKVYNFASTLNRHRRTHSVGIFTCTICQKTLSRTSDKHYHCREVHRIAKSQTCSCCNWTWRSSLELTRHRTSMREMQQSGGVVPVVRMTCRLAALRTIIRNRRVNW